MAILIENETLTSGGANGLTKTSIYIQVKPQILFGASSTLIPCNSGIWGSSEDQAANPHSPTIPLVDQIRRAYQIDPPTGEVAGNSLTEFIKYCNEQVREKIIEDNPSMNPDNITVI